MRTNCRRRSADRPQIKICGLTDPRQAQACAELGADAIGLVFYPKSPRNVAIDQAKGIVAALPPEVTAVGVFVNAAFDAVMAIFAQCGLGGVQLHGRETPELVERLVKENIPVIKALFINGTPGMETAAAYKASAYLVECSGGKLPGGNAMTWDWKAAKAFGVSRPLILAGGLSPANISRAVSEAEPDAVDVSSGVEAEPGKKDLGKVAEFIAAVTQTRINRIGRAVFQNR